MWRYSLLPFFFFPLAISATWAGSVWPAVYVAFSALFYIAADNLTPPLTRRPDPGAARLGDFFLLLQIPLSALLILVLMLKIGSVDRGAWAASALQSVGIALAPFGSDAQAVLAAVAVGFHLSSSTVVAHEMMHRPQAGWRVGSRALLLLNGDPQFQEAHLFGHHAHVATHRDPASARRGEPIYNFLVRSSWGQLIEAYAYEANRLSGIRGARWWRHRLLRAHLLWLALLAGAAAAFGWAAAGGWLIAMLVSKLLLECINYIQHYGLEREPRTRVQAHHSWDCSSRGSSLVLYNLTRHADHHANARKPFHELGIAEQARRLPHGYMLTIMIALVPPLWFRYIEPRLSGGRGRS